MKEKEETLNTILSSIEESAAPILTRVEVSRLTGNLISPRTLANKDSLQIGIQPRLKLGGRVAYPREAVIAYLRKNTEIF